MAISGTFSAGDEVTFNDVSIDIDQTPSSSDFKAVESWATNITVSGGDTPTTDFKTYTTPMVFTGEINPYEVQVEFVYTEGANDPFIEIFDDYAASPGLAYDVRWSPSGGASGDVQYTTTGGKLVNVTLPQMSANDSGAVVTTITIRCSSITRGTAS